MSIDTPQVRTRRGSELFLLACGLGIGAMAYAIIGFALDDSIPAEFFTFIATMSVLGLLLHAVIRKAAPFADPLIMPIAFALNNVGLAMIFRISRAMDSDLATKQLGWTAVSIVACAVVVFFVKDHRILRRYTYVTMLSALVLAMLPLVPFLGREINGAQIWIHIGPFSLQPAEFSKILLAVFFAGYLVENRDRLALAGPKIAGIQLPRMRDFGPIILVWVTSIVILVMQRDLGTSLLIFGLFVAMLYIATERISWIVIGFLMFSVGVVAALSQFTHVQSRFDAWLHALDNEVFNAEFGGSGQLVRGMYGMASGGLFGTGLGEGRPTIVPFSYSDFIFASLGEELGLTGIFAILLLYVLFVQRGFRVALGTRDGFGKLLASGLAFVIAWQMFVVIGGVTRVIPLTGLTTPFMAYGGSSLLANWVIVAILLRISDNARRPSPLPLRGATGSEDDGTRRRSAVINDANVQAVDPHDQPEQNTEHFQWMNQLDNAGTQVIQRRDVISAQEAPATTDAQPVAPGGESGRPTTAPTPHAAPSFPSARSAQSQGSPRTSPDLPAVPQPEQDHTPPRYSRREDSE
ncbi:FtsW/RodA/SpoVE family cell cycle protein [Jonesia quinghaiensis]|uniref:FtsW/RodA/SpoVE family cell cycle protein n=1 Tax=Jonesia quinghaiensis TaxID=262806 RepID=UPI000417EB0F|nr:FtsW/RodA/SpoVE family cell cycle protein [Jonesia quinghaiensis]